MTDTTDLLPDGASAPAAQDAPAPRTRRRATSATAGEGLAALVLPELQAMAGELGISGVGRLRKSQLIEAIQQTQRGGTAKAAAAGIAATAPGAGSGSSKASVTAAAEPEADAHPPAEPGGATTMAPADDRPVRAPRNSRSARAPSATGAPSSRGESSRTDAASSDGASLDGAGSNGAGSNGAGYGGAGSNGAGSNGASLDGASLDGASLDGAGSNGAGYDDARSDDARSGGAPAPSGRPDSSDEAGDANGADAQGEDRDDDGRPERVDRGRERFLEREARRQERLAAAGEDGGSDAGSENGARPDRGPRNDRDDRPERGERQDRGDRPDRGERPDRGARSDRGDRFDRGDAPGGGASGGQAGGGLPGQPGQAGTRDDEEFGTGRRGRFRERGRGRNRSTSRPDRFGGNEPDPLVSDDDVLIPVGGILDVLDNYGFIRTTGYLTGPNDVYVTLQQIRKYGLRRGDAVTGAVRQQREGERKDKYNALVRLDSVNGLDPSEAHSRPDFSTLTPLYPQDRLRLETDPSILTTRVIDLVMPVGKGQRALIVSPPKAGKTMVMQAIANAITTNSPECHLMVVLVDERPEEVTDMQRSVKGEVIASTFDRPPQDHITVAELSIERAKRLVELGHDVVVLLDSITRLGRAYNLGAPASGRILTGGVDSAALYPPKRFLGAARNIENGGSLTIFATALVETGSAMDTVIFEEFKGTGNAELKLDRRLADKRIFPAIDVDASGTRKEEILLAPEELRIVLQLRRVLHALDSTASLELLLSKVKSTRTNVEFLMQIQKTTVEGE